MATQSMFTNPYDAQIAQQEASRARALESSKIPWYQRGAYEGQMAGEDFGRSLGGMLGMQTAEEAKQAKIEDIMGQYGEGAKTPEQLRDIAGDFGNAGMMDLMQETLGMIDSTVGKTTAAQKQNLADMDATLSFLESSKGFKLNPEEAAYFKSRIKKDVSVTMGGQVIDTAPNVFDQIISARGKTTVGSGIGDTSLTEGGLEKKVGELSTKVLKADLSDLDVALSDAENMFNKYGDKNIPGLSQLNIIERQTEEGAVNSGTVEAVKNILLKLRSGAAVTESEQERFLNEISGAKVMTDSLWKGWISRIRKLVEQKKKDLFAGERQDVLDLYWSRQGTSFKKTDTSTTEKQQDVLSKYGLK